MELDDLKYQLKNKLATDHAGMSREDIAALLTKRTVSITDRLKRNLWVEFIAGIVIVLGFSYIGFAGSFHSLRIYFSVFAALSLVFLVFLFLLHRRISRLSATPLPVKGNLQTIVKIVEEFIKRYFQFTMALIPVCFFFALFLGIADAQPVPEAERAVKKVFNTQWKIILFLSLYAIGLGIGVYYFTKWYLRKLYGKYVAQLKDCIAELGE